MIEACYLEPSEQLKLESVLQTMEGSLVKDVLFCAHHLFAVGFFVKKLMH